MLVKIFQSIFSAVISSAGARFSISLNSSFASGSISGLKLVGLELDLLLDLGPAERAAGGEGVLALPAAADVAARQEQDITLKIRQSG